MNVFGYTIEEGGNFNNTNQANLAEGSSSKFAAKIRVKYYTLHGFFSLYTTLAEKSYQYANKSFFY
jgi:hypothetical protein